MSAILCELVKGEGAKEAPYASMDRLLLLAQTVQNFSL